VYRLTHFNFEDDPSFASRLNGLLAMNNYYNYLIEGNMSSFIIGCGMLSFQQLFWPFEGYNTAFFFAPNTYLDLIIEHGLLVTILIVFFLVKYSKKVWKFKGYPALSMKLLSSVFISLLFMAFFYTLKSYLSNMLLLAFYIVLLIKFPFHSKELGEDFG
jgi:ABC-type xylose transport system permease subunit